MNNACTSTLRNPGRTRFGRALALALVFATVFSSCVHYNPKPVDAVPFMERAQSESGGGLDVTVAVLSEKETQEVFGTDLYKKGVQPVWVEVKNSTEDPYYLVKRAMDVDYFPPGEAAYMSRYRTTGRIFRWGLLSLLFLPSLAITVPVGLVEAWRARSANQAMARDFADRQYHPFVVDPGETASGFVFTSIDPGTKQVDVALLGPDATKTFTFFVEVPGYKLDYHEKELVALYEEEEIIEVDEEELLSKLEPYPCCTTRKDGTGEGDPLNIVVIGTPEEVLHSFLAAGWDETEALTKGSAWRTFKAGIFGGDYRISPMSELYVFGRGQDVGFQKIRSSIHQRHHFRLWYLPLRFQGKPVWLGAASRDIGVYLTWRAWNLTTHAIDPDVDDARQYIGEDLLEAERLAAVGSVGGIGASTREEPRRNLMNAPWWSDGERLAMVLAEPPVHPLVLDWESDAEGVDGVRADDTEASGVVWIGSQSISLGVGVSWGTGSLIYKGDRHRFTMKGVSLLDLSIASASATGHVYNLNDISDFAGRYVAAEAGFAVAEGVGALTARNEKGVVLSLKSDRRGAQLSLGSQGFEIELRD